MIWRKDWIYWVSKRGRCGRHDLMLLLWFMSVFGYFKVFACGVCVCMSCVVIKRTKMSTGKTWKPAIFSTPSKHSHWLFGCIQKAKTFIALLAKATFLHSGAVQRKSTKSAHITVPEILFEQVYLLGLTPLHFFFFPLFEKVHLTVAELNQRRWTFHENFLRYFFSSKLWNFKEHF